MRPSPFASIAGCVLAGCAVVYGPPDRSIASLESTYGRVLARAEGGDPESQNAVGYMLYRGEGVSVDVARARGWFERAASQGNARAKGNLAFIAANPMATVSTPKSGTSALARTDRFARGEWNYVRYCGGCHGINGIAAYENSPSFAFGERLHKDDAALMRSLLAGMQEMPGWDGKLPVADLRDILAFVRTLPAQFNEGIAAPPRSMPDYIYLFGPMEARRRAALQ